MSRLLAPALAGAVLGCTSARTLAMQIQAAAQPGHLPRVVACWEKDLETAGFRGEYVATVDMVVEGGTSRLRDARVTAMQPPDARGEALAACVEEALNGSALPREPDREGPGFAASSDILVRGYRIAFVGPSEEERARAAARLAHVLLGPRADRCQGLYAYDPPRDASTLFAEVAEHKQRAEGLAGGDTDLYARALQKAYDTELELRERLRLDAAEPDLPKESRRRLLKALKDAHKDAERTGSLIGCKAPPLPR
jgi:hypothetical protein